MLTIRRARPEDVPAITEIYNEAVLTTTATFDTEPKSLADRQAWFAGHDERHPILVAETEGAVVGWASLSKWSDRCAYADTAEVSAYIKEEWRGKGIGRKLLEAIVEEGRRVKLHTIVAYVSQGNEVSLHLHKAVGFQEIGVAREVGRKFGRLLDVHIMQKIYE